MYRIVDYVSGTELRQCLDREAATGWLRSLHTPRRRLLLVDDDGIVLAFTGDYQLRRRLDEYNVGQRVRLMS